MLNALQADAKSVDLRGLEVYFFEGASRVLELLEEEEVLGEGLCEVRVLPAGEVSSLIVCVVYGYKGGKGGRKRADGNYYRRLRNERRRLRIMQGMHGVVLVEGSF